jgi:hypothetical protein
VYGLRHECSSKATTYDPTRNTFLIVLYGDGSLLEVLVIVARGGLEKKNGDLAKGNRLIEVLATAE